jgi:uncharacterized phage-associated protein
MKCIDIAKYFLTLADPEAGDLISNLKLQKLVYYAQGFYLAINETPLFDEPIEAWQHGPVVADLYHEYCKFGGESIPCPDDFDPASIDPEVSDLLDETYDVFGQFSAWKLRNMTHAEPPWKDNFVQGKSSVIIPTEEMMAYFKTQLN